MQTTLLTLGQAAERMNVAENTLRYWQQRGTAPKSFKLGRRRMFKVEDVDAFIDEKSKAIA